MPTLSTNDEKPKKIETEKNRVLHKAGLGDITISQIVCKQTLFWELVLYLAFETFLERRNLRVEGIPLPWSKKKGYLQQVHWRTTVERRLYVRFEFLCKGKLNNTLT